MLIIVMSYSSQRIFTKLIAESWLIIPACTFVMFTDAILPLRVDLLLAVKLLIQLLIQQCTSFVVAMQRLIYSLNIKRCCIISGCHMNTPSLTFFYWKLYHVLLFLNSGVYKIIRTKKSKWPREEEALLCVGTHDNRSAQRRNE